MATQLGINRRSGFHVTILVGLIILLILLYSNFGTGILRDSFPAPLDENISAPPQPPATAVRRPCIGPRGRPVQENPDDRVWDRSLDLRMY